MINKLEIIYKYLLENAELLNFNPLMTFGDFIIETVTAYSQDNANCESLDEFIEYELSHLKD